MDPFRSFSDVVPEETRERVLSKILKLRKGDDRELSREIDEIIDQSIRIKGFRQGQASHAPEPQL